MRTNRATKSWDGRSGANIRPPASVNIFLVCAVPDGFRNAGRLLKPGRNCRDVIKACPVRSGIPKQNGFRLWRIGSPLGRKTSGEN